MSGWDEKMEELRGRFIDRTKAHGRSLEYELPGRDQLEAIAHRINGSAGMFGFTQLGTAAEALEEALRNQCDDEVVSQHVDRLRQEIDRLQAR